MGVITKGKTSMETAAFGAGCFWGVEETFRQLKGVRETAVGYMGGSLKNPSDKEVYTDKTGHAEVVWIKFAPSEISYEKLLDVFWASHDPTTRNRQGPDFGTQYRSVIFFYGKRQEAAAKKSREKMNKEKFNGKIVTEIVPAAEFYKAEEYHQKYYMKKGGGSCKF